MPIYDGVVTIEDTDVQVILGLDDDRVRLSAGGTEIGDWPLEECEIDDAGDGVYTITAENETLEFMPASPGAFAAAMNGGRLQVPEPPETSGDELDDYPAPAPLEADLEGEDAKPMTMAVFYVLAAVTAVLGLWALITLVF